MSVLKMKALTAMSVQERAATMQELRMELVKSHVTAQKAKAKTKEIKKAIARLLTWKEPRTQEGRA